MEKNNGKSKHYLSVFALTMMSVAVVMSLRGLPMMAKEGLTMFFYLLFAALLFLVPVSLVSAEMATGWPQSGGVYRWVKEAFGARIGFVAIWLQWLQNVIWYPVVLSFAAGALSYLFFDEALASNKFFNLLVILVVYWISTLISFKGLKTSGKLTTYGVICGTLIPGVFIIVLGILWIVLGNKAEFLSAGAVQANTFFPDFSNFNSIAFLAGIVLLFAGMEVGAVHVTEMKNPTKQFPKAIFSAMFLIIIIFTCGSLAIATVMPTGDIDLNAGIMQGFKELLHKFGINWLLPVMGLLAAFGAVGGVFGWIAGPSKGLLATAKDGDLPPFMAKTNKHGVQRNILLIQGCIVTVVSFVFLIMPNVSSAFFILSILTVAPYLVMYLLLYASAIRLRYTQPDVPRAYKLPGGKFVMWLIAGIGILAVLFAFIIGFFPPSQLEVGSPLFYVLFLAIGVLVFVLLPIIIGALKKPEWKKDADKE
ncbi:MAG: amino acid permease [Bacteroidales bacterium]|nr:amino acid permease [Bacteroidota bacterium]MBL6949774.1 amino acid permease [Bacteroidales bacterium]